jgi:hypothetical protein
MIDYAANPTNIWQIGAPAKTLFNAALSAPNAIITKLNSVYPVNDTSSFIIYHLVDFGLIDLGTMDLIGRFQINSDTLTDYGKIEFSPDNGQTWINALTDSINFIPQIYPKPILSGNAPYWQYFDLVFWDANHQYNFQWGDTVLWKLTFISDSNQTNKDGWMLDDIMVADAHEGIPEFTTKNILTYAYPNPASDQTTIFYSNQNHDILQLMVFDPLGRTVMEKMEINGTETNISMNNLPPGLYFYKVYNSQMQGNGKIIIR